MLMDHIITTLILYSFFSVDRSYIQVILCTYKRFQAKMSVLNNCSEFTCLPPRKERFKFLRLSVIFLRKYSFGYKSTCRTLWSQVKVRQIGYIIYMYVDILKHFHIDNSQYQLKTRVVYKYQHNHEHSLSHTCTPQCKQQGNP